MKCPVCFAETAADMKFCEACGVNLIQDDIEEAMPDESGASKTQELADEPKAAEEQDVPAVSQPVATESTTVPQAVPVYTAPGVPYAVMPQPPYYQAYAVPPVVVKGDSEKNWAAISSLICGICSLPCSITFLGGVITGAAAVIFGAMGLKSAKRGMSIAGLVCGCLGLAFSLVMFFIIVATDAFYYEF